MKIDEVWFKRSKLVKPLISFYFFLGILKIIVEYHQDRSLVNLFAPLPMLILILIYGITSKIKNRVYIVALFVASCSGFSIGSRPEITLLIETLVLFFSIVLILYLVLQNIKSPGTLLWVMSSLPFACFAALVLLIINYKSGLYIFWFLFKSLFVVFFGGLVLANYLRRYRKANAQLFAGGAMISLALFFLMLARSFTENKYILPMSTAFFMLGHYLLYKFILSRDNKHKRYKVIS